MLCISFWCIIAVQRVRDPPPVPATDQTSPFELELELASVWQTNNDAEIPSDSTATRFRLAALRRGCFALLLGEHGQEQLLDGVDLRPVALRVDERVLGPAEPLVLLDHPVHGWMRRERDIRR